MIFLDLSYFKILFSLCIMKKCNFSFHIFTTSFFNDIYARNEIKFDLCKKNCCIVRRGFVMDIIIRCVLRIDNDKRPAENKMALVVLFLKFTSVSIFKVYR